MRDETSDRLHELSDSNKGSKDSENFVDFIFECSPSTAHLEIFSDLGPNVGGECQDNPAARHESFGRRDAGVQAEPAGVGVPHPDPGDAEALPGTQFN